MKILSRMSIVLVATVSISAITGCNGSNDSNDKNTTFEKNLAKSGVTFDSDKMKLPDVKAAADSDGTQEYLIPEVYPDLTTLKLDYKSKEKLNKALHLFSKEKENSGLKSALIHKPDYNPGCTKLEINQAYNYRPNQGSQGCFYFDVPNDSRVEFFALQQTASRQVNILANHDVNANYSLSYVGETSDNDADDNFRFWAQAGHYYMFLNDIASDNETVDKTV